MKKTFSLFVAAMLTAGFIAGCSGYPGIRSGGVAVETDDVAVSVAFGHDDVRIIRDYYAKKRKGLPPGLAKKKKLPPGLQKRAMKHGALPPGLAKRGLPWDLENRLSMLPRGYARLRVGGDVVLLNEATQVVVDIVADVD